MRVRPHRNLGAGVVVSCDAREFRIARDAWEDLGATPGDPIDQGTLVALQADAEERFCRADSIALLARREHSRKELDRKLTRRGYSTRAIAGVLDGLSSRDLQSNQRFAEAFVRSRFRRGGESRLALINGLSARGIDDRLAFEAIDSYERENPGCFTVALDRAVKRLPEQTKHDRSRAIRALTRRGFPMRDVMNRFP